MFCLLAEMEYLIHRELQKQNLAFVAGVLYTNDIDYQLARLLAAHTVTEKPFEEISEQTFTEASKWIDACDGVIDAGITIGSGNRRIEELIGKSAGMIKTDLKKDRR